MFREYFKAFKSNFKLATPIFLVIVLVYIILIINIRNIEVVNDMAWLVLPVQIAVFVEVTFLTLYIFPLISRFEMKFLGAFKTAFYMANRHLLTTITNICILLAVLLGCYLYPLFIVIAVGSFVFATSYFYVRVFKKYRPEIDGDEFAMDIVSETEAEVITEPQAGVLNEINTETEN